MRPPSSSDRQDFLALIPLEFYTTFPTRTFKKPFRPAQYFIPLRPSSRLSFFARADMSGDLQYT